MGATGNKPLLFVLGVNALRSVDGLHTYFSIQHRHPDGHRWFDVTHYATHEDAETAIASAVAAGHATTDELRIQKVSRTIE